jgi:PD-(D/E)XK nuclease superfamily
MKPRMDAAVAVDAQNAPTTTWKPAQNAGSHSIHTHRPFTRPTHKKSDTPRGVNIRTFFCDIVVDGAVLVEIKALPELDSRSVGQLLNYLKVAGGGVGLLLNFGRRPEFSRKIVGNVEKIQA